jgi:hypothetical protein
LGDFPKFQIFFHDRPIKEAHYPPKKNTHFIPLGVGLMPFITLGLFFFSFFPVIPDGYQPTLRKKKKKKFCLGNALRVGCFQNEHPYLPPWAEPYNFENAPLLVRYLPCTPHNFYQFFTCTGIPPNTTVFLK